MLAVVLAAGRGKRLGPLTRNRSKAMLPVCGKPLIERVLDMLAGEGASQFIVVAHPASRDLLTALRSSPRSHSIQCIYQEERLGMAHALACAAPSIRERAPTDFLLAACDNLYPEGHVSRLIEHHIRNALDATLTLMWATPEQVAASALVVLENVLVSSVVEKPSLATVRVHSTPQGALCAPALYALSRQVLDHVSHVAPSARGEYEFPDALNGLIAAGGLVGGQLVEERLTLTDQHDLLVINRRFLRRNRACATIATDIPSNVTVTPPVRIEMGASVDRGCKIGPEVYLEAGCRVQSGAVVRRAVVLKGAAVAAGQIVEEVIVA
jgi:glucose-1-phosphate thymidylyltransferase